jgi:uracil-DNA glycosylase family 4
MELEQGQVVFLSSIDPIITDEAFEKLLVGKSSNTTIPYMRKGKPFIVRGLLTRSIERKAMGENEEIIAGRYDSAHDGVLGRIFLVQGRERATLLWQGPASQFRPNYMRIRDEVAGKVPYRLYGRAAAKRAETEEVWSKTPCEEATQQKRRIETPLEIAETSSIIAEVEKPSNLDSISNSRDEPGWLQKLRECRRCFDTEPELVFIGNEGVARPLFYEEGNLESGILFIFEAPNFTDTFDRQKGRMTLGEGSDPTGLFFEECLRAEVGLDPEQTMIINSVLCLPAYRNGDYPVLPAQRHLCSSNLISIIENVDPKMVVTLGEAALQALSLIEFHGLIMRDGVARPHDWFGRTLIPLYHPSNRGRVYRKTQQQRADYRKLRDYMDSHSIILH